MSFCYLATSSHSLVAFFTYKKRLHGESAALDRKENLNRHLIVKVVTFDLLTIFLFK